MQPVNLVRVFIASPSDVTPERDAAVQVIYEWNAAFSLGQRAAIEAVRMETHAEAALGRHPQELINRQLLDCCDLLIAIFWSKLGSPTPTAVSGTVDEIEEFCRLKGSENVLLFFADKDSPKDVKLQDLKRLDKFKDDIKTKGLFIPYKDVEEFQKVLRHQLDMRMQQFTIPKGVLVSHGTPMVALESDGAGTRIDEFRSLRAQAQHSLYVMGVGMTLFSADVTLMHSLISKGLSIRLLMIDPVVIASSRRRRAQKDSPDVSIMEDSFSSYFSRKGYGNDVRSSLSRLKERVAEAGKAAGAGSIELRTYPYFIPMNFTAVDESHSGKVLLEFCLPFSDQRLRMLFSKRHDGELFARVMENCEGLWTLSTHVISVNVNSRTKD